MIFKIELKAISKFTAFRQKKIVYSQMLPPHKSTLLNVTFLLKMIAQRKYPSTNRIIKKVDWKKFVNPLVPTHDIRQYSDSSAVLKSVDYLQD